MRKIFSKQKDEKSRQTAKTKCKRMQQLFSGNPYISTQTALRKAYKRILPHKNEMNIYAKEMNTKIADKQRKISLYPFTKAFKMRKADICR